MQNTDQSSIKAGVFQRSYNQHNWVYSDLCELLFISEGTGQRIVGDNINRFEPGDLVFIGKQLPHTWVSDPIILDPGSDRCVESIFIQFDPHILEGKLVELFEFKSVKEALKRSQRGCIIKGKARNKIAEMMMEVPYLSGFRQITNLLNILNLIGTTDEFEYLASREYVLATRNHKSDRVQEIQEFLMKNHQNVLNIKQLADLFNMQPASLCRFYKNQTGMTISEYLNKLRIDLASKMLLNKHLLIEEIAFECGFNTTSFFNRQFKKYRNTSPSQFRKMFSEN